MENPNKRLINLENVSIKHAEHQVLENVNLEIGEGEFVYLIGKTGSGKSSLLRVLYGDLPISSGIGMVSDTDLGSVDKKNVHLLRKKLGIVFQDFGLLTDRTVSDNLKFVLEATGWAKSKMDGRISEVLTLVGLANKGYKFPHELSGGEQQRVAIARALLNSPALLVADEPTGNLDPETTNNILQLMHDITKMGCSVIMATHDHESMSVFPGRKILCSQGSISEI